MASCKECAHSEVCALVHMEGSSACCEFAARSNYVEVVRCKDCKHRDDGMCLMEEEYHYPWHKVEDDDFCSRGESKHIPNGDCT